MSDTPVCKNGSAWCGVHWDCGKCTHERYESIWKNMSPVRRAYDRRVDPQGAYTSGLSAPGGDRYLFEDSCSCHINPPCSYCVSKGNEEEEPA